jgi:YbbR domain-containing protein
MDKWMKNNNFNKILALVFGVILWTIVHVDTEPTNQTTVNTESKIIENVKIARSGFDDEKYIYTMDVDSVRLEVRGKRSDLNFKLSDAYKVSVDLSGLQPGDTTLPLNYSLPSGVMYESMEPKQVNVHVELRTTKSFPVTISTKGEPAAGYQVGTPVIQPETAEVTLADSELSRVAKVQGIIELDGESETFKEKKLKLYAYDSSGKEIEDAVIEPASVSVELPITLPFKSLPLDISFSGQLPGSLVVSRVTPEVDAVNVFGNKEVLAGLSSYEATLDLSSITSAGTQKLPLELKPPEGATKVDPGTVNVSVTTAEIAQRTIEAVPIKLEGVANGLTALMTDPSSKTVSLTVSGAPTLLDQLDQDNISVVADVGGYAAGVHQVTLQVSLPRFIALVNAAQPLTATVDLQVPSTPESSEAPATETAVTPEPSSEPVAGEEITAEPSPSHNGDSAATPTPSPTESTAESSSTPTGNGNSNNAGSTGGT